MDSGGMSLVIDEEVANRAACIIQRAWRCWVNKAPFKWCKARVSTFYGLKVFWWSNKNFERNNPNRNKFFTFFGARGNPI